MKVKKHIFALALSVAMVLGLAVSVGAAEVIDITTLNHGDSGPGWWFNGQWSNRVLMLTGEADVTVTSHGIRTDRSITIENVGTTANLTIQDLYIHPSDMMFAIDVIGNGSTLNLTVREANTLTSIGLFAGISVGDGASLNICGDGIVATRGGNNGGAGIGGNAFSFIDGDGTGRRVGNITVLPSFTGTINAQGGWGGMGGGAGAGIGGGARSGAGTIVIGGGTINARGGGQFGSGIGTGGAGTSGVSGSGQWYGIGGSITITGGVVNATVTQNLSAGHVGRNGIGGVGVAGEISGGYVFARSNNRFVPGISDGIIITGGTVDSNAAQIFVASVMPNGAGTPQDPWQIYVPGHFLWINEERARLSGYFLLMNDIDATILEGDVMISAHGFTGNFDGNGHAVTVDIDRTGADSGVLGLFRRIEDTGKVENLTVKGRISGGSTIGGLAGVNGGTIVNSRSTASVSGANGIGVL